MLYAQGLARLEAVGHHIVEAPMTDERLQESRRRWRQTGSVEDEAKYYLECVRAGALTRERLQFAAHVGHTAARLATGFAVGQPTNLIGVLTSARACGDATLVEAARLLAHHCLSAWDRVMPDKRPHETLEAVQAWLERPDRAHAIRVERTSAATTQSADGSGRFLAQRFPQGTFTMSEIREFEAMARTAQHLAEMVTAVCERKPDATNVAETTRRFAQAVADAGLELTDGLGVLLRELATELLISDPSGV